jgi:hypothetical protein
LLDNAAVDVSAWAVDSNERIEVDLRDGRRVLPRLAPIAARAGGLFTFADALAAGYGPEQVRRLVARGQWVRLRRGIYADRRLLDFCSGDLMRRHAVDLSAAVLAAGPETHVSHESAAFLHGIATFDRYDQRPRLTRPTAAGPRRLTGGELHMAGLPADHRARRHDVPVTSAARTALDLARGGSFRDGVIVADAALSAGIATRADLRKALVDCATWPGIRRAARVVEFAEPKTESPAESIARVVCFEQGLPPPRPQVVLNDGAVDLARVDFYWPEHATVLEIDGLAKYDGGDPGALMREKLRQQRLEELGLIVVRATWHQLVHEPAATADRIRRAFGIAATRPQPTIWMQVA